MEVITMGNKPKNNRTAMIRQILARNPWNVRVEYAGKDKKGRVKIHILAKTMIVCRAVRAHGERNTWLLERKRESDCTLGRRS